MVLKEIGRIGGKRVSYEDDKKNEREIDNSPLFEVNQDTLPSSIYRKFLWLYTDYRRRGRL
jgi:hypothetical protein